MTGFLPLKEEEEEEKEEKVEEEEKERDRENSRMQVPIIISIDMLTFHPKGKTENYHHARIKWFSGLGDDWRVES